jgi:hypothetical protein
MVNFVEVKAGECAMIDVAVTGPDADAGEWADLGNRLLRHYRFSGGSSGGAVSVRVVSEWPGRLFWVDREGGVYVSSAQSDGIALYLGMPRARYLFLCALLGLVQWRALDLNPLLVPEDLLHHNPPRCVFADPMRLEDYVVTLDEVRLCPACMNFFRCLGVEPELLDAAAHFERECIALTP